MQKIIVDTGVEEFEINSGKILRFNPADINVFSRLINAKEKFASIENRMIAKANGAHKNGESAGQTAIAVLSEADAEMKALLGEIFGEENDFDDIFAGVNLMSVAQNGERVITNFLVAVTPILEAGAKKAAKEQATTDVAGIKANRAQCRAQR